ncbi:AAA family ATPase [Stenotrophomonas maltophilia]|uniref:ATP-dependent nuclease n=1 Tax=Stenotrophomonas maltophilia TaxID=40324 RepID=UPI000DA9AF7C|nr:AAA family ATPase [Stenotrophomonas maltophilia]MCI1154921.1 AAA family ATPase [Stenotrophomonas maltophilia]
MFIKGISIKNFRGIEDIDVDLSTRVSVIVGPNAAGKTTILEAVRLVKALLAPRTPNESSQVLFSLGASSPHAPQRLRFQAVAGDPRRPVELSCRYELSADEIAAVEGANEPIARAMVQAQSGNGAVSQDVLIQFLASPAGQARLVAARQEISEAIVELKRTKLCNLGVVWHDQIGPQSIGGPIGAQIIGFLERRLPPNKTAFTYFPADRAMPLGEQQVQLGGPDSQQQLESYNSQPQIKFARLKNLIFTGALFSATESQNGDSLQQQFERIFAGVLKGRSLDGIQINELGMLNAIIKDTDSGRTFDIDGMSSGEKGLILTFLILQRAVVKDGIVLLDEPELHLNPAVCKDLLSYLIQDFVVPKGLQILICSHSPEILAGAFDSDQCAVYHLASPRELSKVRIQDEANLEDTLRRLGANESENLLYKGIVFVEGVDDIAVLEAGFGMLLRRHKLKHKQGRFEVEKAIRRLQELEQDGSVNGRTYFIFDKDEAPTSLQSTGAVRILQWNRRCLENYFIDVEAMSNLLMSSEVLKSPLKNHGEVSTLLKKVAFEQIPEIAAKRVYERYGFEGVGVRREDVRQKSVDEISSAMMARLRRLKERLADVDETTWPDSFRRSIDVEIAQIKQVWESTWKEECDGKRLLEDLFKEMDFKSSLRSFKIKMIKDMALEEADGWKQIRDQLSTVLS